MTYPSLCLKTELWKQRTDGAAGFYYPCNVTAKVGLLLLSEVILSKRKPELKLAEFNGGKYIISQVIPDDDICVELIDMETKKQLDLCLADYRSNVGSLESNDELDIQNGQAI